MALDVEGVEDRCVGWKEFLRLAGALEALHLALASPDGLVRILSSIVLPPPALMAAFNPEIASRCAVWSEFIGDHALGDNRVFLEKLAHQFQRGMLVSLGLDRRPAPNDDAIVRLVGAILLEQNEEWAVRRARYMTLETIAALSVDPVVGLPATVIWPIRPMPEIVAVSPRQLHQAQGHDPDQANYVQGLTPGVRSNSEHAVQILRRDMPHAEEFDFRRRGSQRLAK
jgi:hypothetical protein